MDIGGVLDVFRLELELDEVSGDCFAKSIGMSYASYKNVVRDGSLVVPKWVLAYLFGKGYYFDGDVLLEKKSDASHELCVCSNGGSISHTTSDHTKYDYKYDNE